MYRIDFLCDVVEILIASHMSDVSGLYFDDGVTVRDYWSFFKFVRDNNKAPYLYDHHKDGLDLVIVVRYEL